MNEKRISRRGNRTVPVRVHVGASSIGHWRCHIKTRNPDIKIQTQPQPSGLPYDDFFRTQVRGRRPAIRLRLLPVCSPLSHQNDDVRMDAPTNLSGHAMWQLGSSSLSQRPPCLRPVPHPMPWLTLAFLTWLGCLALAGPSNFTVDDADHRMAYGGNITDRCIGICVGDGWDPTKLYDGTVTACVPPLCPFSSRNKLRTSSTQHAAIHGRRTEVLRYGCIFPAQTLV